MRRVCQFLTVAIAGVVLTGCWEQFTEPEPPPVDDDDTTAFDDDDDSTAVDDDDTSVDDDDSVAVDDDDATDPPPPECAPAATLTCGDVVAGNNGAPDSTEVLTAYGCNGITGYEAPEFAYSFTPDEAGDVLVRISGLEADLDLYVLAAGAGGACDPEGCVGASAGTTDTEEVTFSAAAANTYYFVVDGFGAAVSPYTIEVDCDPDGGDDDDSGPDDDDSGPDDDDDDSVDPCTLPANVSATVALTDPSGNPTSSYDLDNPLTITLSVQNLGGGTETMAYGTQCLFTTSVWDAAGAPQGGERPCLGPPRFEDYVCGAPPTTDTYTLQAIQTPSGNPLASGTYELHVNTQGYGTIVEIVTVP